MTDVQIVNFAFGLLGANRIQAFTDDSTEAGLASAMYAQSRDELMSMHTWKFATTEVQLAQVSGTPLLDYDNIFQLPTDVLKLIRTDNDNYKYAIKDNQLYSNASTVSIEYIKRVTDPAKFSQQFINALVKKLSYEWCFAITNSSSLTELRGNDYLQTLKYSKASESQQQPSRDLNSYRWLTARSTNA